MRTYKPSEFISGMLHSDSDCTVKETSRTCAGKCKQHKPISEFHKKNKALRGYDILCKECRNEKNMEAKNKRKAEKELYSQFMPI